jgi:hypothetical protein
MEEKHREPIVDVFRGIIIINMMLVHFKTYVPDGLSAMINFSDIAIEGFIFISGFMIGRHYLRKFYVSKMKVTKRLFIRSGRLVLIQYCLILTLSLPYHSYFELASRDEVIRFVLDSITFRNQIPVLHILPTFIPLFLISPMILIALKKRWDYFLISLSACVFLFGCYNPYALNIGEETIFPVIVWQIYFVAGAVLGNPRGKAADWMKGKEMICAILIYGLCFVMKYGGYFDEIHGIKAAYGVYPRRFPLNMYGFIYGGSFLFLLYAILKECWEKMGKSRSLLGSVRLMGRHSLAAFFLHTYFVYLVKILGRIEINQWVIYASIALSFYVLWVIIRRIEESRRDGNLGLTHRLLFS